MDNLFAKKWVIKVSSILIAIMLFLMVNMIDATTNQVGGLPIVTDGSRVLEEVDIKVYYDEDNYVLTELPESVQVTLRGPQNVLTLAQATQAQQELFVDLTEVEAGDHEVTVEHRGFPTDLEISIVPSTVSVAIQEKHTVSIPVEVEWLNEGAIEEGYVVGSPSVSPSSVDVTAARGLIEQIATARVFIDLSGRSTPFEEVAPVVFYDSRGIELELNGNPPAVEVDVPVTSPHKDVPIRISRTGELAEGVAINTITTDPENITIYGPLNIIQSISFIEGLSIHLDDINGNTSFEIEVPIPDGVERVDPETVMVEIGVAGEEQQQFNDFEVEIEGLEPGHSIEFLDPENGLFDLIVYGSQEALQRLDRSDIQVVLNVERLRAGEHQATLKFNGPQNLRYEQQERSVSFILSENNTSLDSSEGDEDNGEENDHDTS